MRAQLTGGERTPTSVRSAIRKSRSEVLPHAPQIGTFDPYNDRGGGPFDPPPLRLSERDRWLSHGAIRGSASHQCATRAPGCGPGDCGLTVIGSQRVQPPTAMPAALTTYHWELALSPVTSPGLTSAACR